MELEEDTGGGAKPPQPQGVWVKSTQTYGQDWNLAPVSARQQLYSLQQLYRKLEWVGSFQVQNRKLPLWLQMQEAWARNKVQAELSGSAALVDGRDVIASNTCLSVSFNCR